MELSRGMGYYTRGVRRVNLSLLLGYDCLCAIISALHPPTAVQTPPSNSLNQPRSIHNLAKIRAEHHYQMLKLCRIHYTLCKKNTV